MAHQVRTIRPGVPAALVCWILAGFTGVPAAQAVDTPITITTSSLDFNQVNVGDTRELGVVLTNSGIERFGPIRLFGVAPPTPEFNAFQTCQGATLSLGGTCTIRYSFSPASSGVFNDVSSFTVSETASRIDGEDFSVGLEGVGVGPITAAAQSHDFGNVAVGTTSPSLITVITNAGEQNLGPLTLFGVAPTTPEFAASENCSATTLPPGGTCSIVFTFSPTTPGVVHDRSAFTISLSASQDEGIDFNVFLTGCGTAPGGPCVGPEAVALVIPVAGSTPGNFGSFFRTAVQLSNVGTEPIRGRFVYHPAGVSGSPTDPSLSFSVAPNSTISYDDLIQTMGQTGLGTLDVMVPSGSPIPVVVARVYNDAGAEGTNGCTEAGIFVVGSDSRVLRTGYTGLLLGPPNDASQRFNIGVRTLFVGANLIFRIRDANGTVVHTVTKSYGPTLFEQLPASTFLGAPVPPNGSIEVDVFGSAIIYGATIDNVTNDPSIQFAQLIAIAF